MWFSLIDIWNCIPFKHTFHVRVRLLDRGHWWATGYGCLSGTACRPWRPWGCPSWRLLKHRNQNKSVATNKSTSRFSIQRKKKKKRIKFHIWGTLRNLPLLLLLVWLAALLIKTKKRKEKLELDAISVILLVYQQVFPILYFQVTYFDTTSFILKISKTNVCKKTVTN